MIRFMLPEDIGEVSVLRERFLNDTFSELGKVFLEKYYFPSFYYSPHGFVLVSVNDKNEIQGYVAGSYDFNKQKRFINSRMIVGLFLTFLINPVKFYKTIIKSGKTKITTDLSSFGKLSSMVVNPEFQGQGIGKALTNALLTELNQNNLNKCYLFCKTDNIAAIKVYHHMGFEDSEEFHQNGFEYMIMIADTSSPEKK